MGGESRATVGSSSSTVVEHRDKPADRVGKLLAKRLDHDLGRADVLDQANPLPDNGSLLQRLQHQCAQRAPLFASEREQAALLALVDSLWIP